MFISANTKRSLWNLKQLSVEAALAWIVAVEARITEEHRSSYADEGRTLLEELEAIRNGGPLPQHLADLGREKAEAFLIDQIYDLCRCASDRAIGWAADWSAEWALQKAQAEALGVKFN